MVHCLSCTSRASYGIKGTGISIYCLQHKMPEHTDEHHPSCNKDGCSKRPSYGIKGTKTALTCTCHKLKGYINVTTRTCKDCDKIPYFGIVGTKKGEYCYDHKPNDYVNVVSPVCIECPKLASYAKVGTYKLTHCAEHHPSDYVRKTTYHNCINLGCTKCASFAENKTAKAQYCGDHKPDNYVDKTHKKCVQCNKTRPSFGKKGTQLAEYCIKCIPIDVKDQYINVIDKMCQSCNIKIPTFGDPIKRIPEFCKEHSPENYVDVVNKICEEKDCDIRAHNGKLFDKAIHCAKHRKPNEYFKNRPKCIECNDKYPCYTDQPNNYPLRCETHKLTTDQNVVEQPCKSCGLSFYIKEGNLCNDCSTFITQKVTKIQETKVKMLLEVNGFKFIQDRPPTDGCYKYRPDFQIDAGHSMIIVEVDENQHQSYACECEMGRMISIFQDYGGMPVTFVRYNPDKYLNNLKQSQLGSSGLNQRRLIDTIRSLQLHQPTSPLMVTYLCYDGDDGQVKLDKIDYENNMVKPIETFQVEQFQTNKILIKRKIQPKIPIKLKTTYKIPIKPKSSLILSQSSMSTSST